MSLLKTRFVPVAIDQAYQRRQRDAEGDFYRQIAGQGPRNNFESTTQGLYIATPAGKLLDFSNDRGAEKIRAMMTGALEAFGQMDAATTPEDPALAAESPAAGAVDGRFNVEPPEGGLVLRVHAKVMGGYEETTDPWQQISQQALSRDNLWISRDEHMALVRGELPSSLQQRLVRFHLIDNTRGEPPMWKHEEVRARDMKLQDGRVSGRVLLQTDDEKRGYDAEVLGLIETGNDHVVSLAMVVRGDYWGEGPYTPGAPKGRFPLAISFTLADGSDIADRVPPQGSRGCMDGYMRPGPSAKRGREALDPVANPLCPE